MGYLETKNSYITVGEKRIAYRELSKGKSRLPLVMLVHLAAKMDNWDPKLIDLLSAERHILLLDFPGVGSSEGRVEERLTDTAKSAIEITHALGYERIHLLGLSMGGMIAQEMVRSAPDLAEKLILVGTGPRAGKGIDSVTPVPFLCPFLV